MSKMNDGYPMLGWGKYFLQKFLVQNRRLLRVYKQVEKFCLRTGRVAGLFRIQMEKNKTKLAECVDNATGVDKKEKIIDFSKIYITDRFMFPLVMSHKEIAKPFIEAALGIKIYDLRDPEQEKTEQVGIFSKSVRYDVFTQQIDEKGKTISSFVLE